MIELPAIFGFNGSSDVGENSFGVSVFLAKCNLKCPYCMNSKLVLGEDLNQVDINEVKKFVQENKRNWVTISGGEPTCTETTKLINLFNEIKSWGCKIGLSTNGTHSDTLRQILGYLDYVALDIKTSRSEVVYSETGYVDIFRSLYAITKEKKERSEFNYEIRTTLYPPFVNKEDITSIAQVLRKDDKWVLQQFRMAKNRLVKNEVQPYSEAETNELLKIAQEYIPRTSLGYV